MAMRKMFVLRWVKNCIFVSFLTQQLIKYFLGSSLLTKVNSRGDRVAAGEFTAGFMVCGLRRGPIDMLS